VSPVTCNGAEVVLSASPAKASNYPVAAVQAAFNAAGQGNVPAGNATLTYNTYARLMGLQVFDSYGGGTGVSTTWEITSDGGLVGSPKATVEILALIETPKVPASTYGAFGTDDQCGALTFGGNVTINSYDSTGMVGSTAPAMSHRRRVGTKATSTSAAAWTSRAISHATKSVFAAPAAPSTASPRAAMLRSMAAWSSCPL
jgi:hypothetical protein